MLHNVKYKNFLKHKSKPQVPLDYHISPGNWWGTSGAQEVRTQPFLPEVIENKLCELQAKPKVTLCSSSLGSCRHGVTRRWVVTKGGCLEQPGRQCLLSAPSCPNTWAWEWPSPSWGSSQPLCFITGQKNTFGNGTWVCLKDIGDAGSVEEGKQEGEEQQNFNQAHVGLLVLDQCTDQYLLCASGRKTDFSDWHYMTFLTGHKTHSYIHSRCISLAWTWIFCSASRGVYV